MFSYILGLHSLRKRRGALFPCYLSVSYTGNAMHSFHFIKNIFRTTLRLRVAPKFKKMYGIKLEHPRSQPNCTYSYKKECIWGDLCGKTNGHDLSLRFGFILGFIVLETGKN